MDLAVADEAYDIGERPEVGGAVPRPPLHHLPLDLHGVLLGPAEARLRECRVEFSFQPAITVLRPQLVRFYDFADINRALADAAAGDVVKPIVRMPASR